MSTQLIEPTPIIAAPIVANIEQASDEEYTRCRRIVEAAIAGPSYVVPIDYDNQEGFRHAWEITSEQINRGGSCFGSWIISISEPARLVLDGKRWELDKSGLNSAQADALSTLNAEAEASMAMAREAAEMLRLSYYLQQYHLDRPSRFSMACMHPQYTRASHRAVVYVALLFGFDVPDAVIDSHPDIREIVDLEGRPWRITDYFDKGQRASYKTCLANIDKSDADELVRIEKAQKGMNRCKLESSTFYRHAEVKASAEREMQKNAEYREIWSKYLALCHQEDDEAPLHVGKPWFPSSLMPTDRDPMFENFWKRIS